jgi:choline-sulfatase
MNENRADRSSPLSSVRCVLFCALAASAICPCPLRASERLNVLWICADDHAAYVCGAYGNKVVRTPNLDRLARQGMRFDRAYCNAPVCTASRQSFLTGRYPRSLGVTQLSTALPPGTPTLATMMKAAGYDTAAIGKMHFNSALTHGFDLRLDMPDFRKALTARGAKPLPEGVRVQPPWRPFRDPARVWLNSACLPFGAVQADMYGTWLAEKGAEYLAKKRDRPFFLMVSFTEPHSPFHFPVEYRGRHDPKTFSVPKVAAADEGQVPAIFRDLTPREKQGIVAAYYTSTEFMDHNAGLVLDALKRAGLEERTLVVYTGDHGYMLGQHGRFEKHCSYEPAVRAPLLLRRPGKIRANQSTSALVEFIDIAPTLLQACGVKVPAEVQGRSLLPLLEGKTATHREHVIAEYSENEEAMIRTDRYKLVYSTGKRLRQDGYATGKPLPGRTVRLFDLDNDPEELTDVSREPDRAARVRTLTHLLAEHMKRTARVPDLVPKTDNDHEVLEHCLQPRDVTWRQGKK